MRPYKPPLFIEFLWEGGFMGGGGGGGTWGVTTNLGFRAPLDGGFVVGVWGGRVFRGRVSG